MTPEEQKQFAANCRTTVAYIRKVFCVKGLKFGAILCSLIEKESKGKVSRKHLRPDDWYIIWPELSKKKAKETA